MGPQQDPSDDGKGKNRMGQECDQRVAEEVEHSGTETSTGGREGRASNPPRRRRRLPGLKSSSCASYGA